MLDQRVATGATRSECEPKLSPSAESVRRYLDIRRDTIRGLDPEMIHRLHAGDKLECSLRVSDLRALVSSHCDLLEALQLYTEHFGDPLKVARSAIAKATRAGVVPE